MSNNVFLYVEDDPMSRDALTIVLKRVIKAEHIYVFENSQDFIERVAALPVPPDIILLDIYMKPISGFEMLRLLRQELGYADAKIVALTASVMNEDMDLLKESGFDAVIGKPINVRMFPNLIERITNGEVVWHITDT